MALNIFYEGYSSVNGYQSYILNEIDKQVHFDGCVLTNQDCDGKDSYGEKYKCINYDICTNSRYELFYDMNDFLPLERDILEQMQPYESMAMKLLVRITEYDIFNYDESKRLYLQNLRFWNHIFTTEKINFAFFSGIPHHTHDYVIYCLCKVKNIPICIITPTHMRNRWFVGTSLDTIGENTLKEYRRLLNTNEEIVLPEDLEKYYNDFICQKKQAVSTVMDGLNKKAKIKSIVEINQGYVNSKKVLKRSVSRIKRGVTSPSESRERKEAFGLLSKDLSYVKRTKRRIKSGEKPSDYDKIAQNPVANEKYILFLLHLQPEATTLPQAEVFVEQDLPIRILAQAVDGTGIKIYVKEHYVQPWRDKNFYSDLASIKNVILIRSDVDSKPLVLNSVACSTCTGTVALEATANEIPVMLFSKGGFDDGPGMFYVSSVNECKEVLQKILNKEITISKDEVRRYLQAFVNASVRHYSPHNGEISHEELLDSQKQLVDVVVSRIKGGLS